MGGLSTLSWAARRSGHDGMAAWPLPDARACRRSRSARHCAPAASVSRVSLNLAVRCGEERGRGGVARTRAQEGARAPLLGHVPGAQLHAEQRGAGVLGQQ